MINISKPVIILSVIIVIAAFLRFFALGTNPPALTWDEAAWGYNAYTIGQTGQDEFGKFLPVTYLESFGDFKPPMYAYLSVIPIRLLGVSEFSIRFTSAFFGTLTVLLTYFLVLMIFPLNKNKKSLALISSLTLAISPWHILLSRAAFEANVATFFIVLGTLLFLVATKNKIKAVILGASLLSFVAATYTFNTSRVFLPIFVPLLFLLKWKIALRGWKKVIVAAIPAVLIGIPLLFFLLTPQAKLRYQEVNIFSDIQIIERVNQEIKNDDYSLFSKIIHNRRLTFGVEYLKHYMDNLDPGFLFIHGDGNPKFSIQDVGEMYIWELPFIIIGIIMIIRKREGNWLLIPFWLILGIIPAATARETPHALRIETVLPVPQIVVGYGLVFIAEKVSSIKYSLLRIKLKDILFGIFGFISLIFFIYFVHTYFVHYPVQYASEWQYGYKNAVAYAQQNKNKYENIYVTEGLGRPYIYFLLYGNYPSGSLNDAKVSREALGFVHVNSFGKYTFFNDLPFDMGNTLYINVPDRVPSSAHIVKEFKLPDGKTALKAYEK